MLRTATALSLLLPTLRMGSGDSALSRARKLRAPKPSSTRDGEYEHAEFWEVNDKTLRQAWQEFGINDTPAFSAWSDQGLVPGLREAVRAVQDAPSEEADLRVRELWKEVAPGVFAAQFFDVEYIGRLRAELDRLSAAGIPTRRPNGMNRHGLILSEGLPLGAWVEGLVRELARPLAYTLFPKHVGPGDAAEHYAFTVRYREGEDVALAEHRDASVATLNVNLNMDKGDFGGSLLRFVDAEDPAKTYDVRFAPGMAVVHLGALRHAALPIHGGERTNLIVWLMGEGGYVRFAPYEEETLPPAHRWSEALSAQRPYEIKCGEET
mmetsp:Transcript_2884/g.8513  ORF Transcript_2884/g.8513 Transcript_2884/m.8513 type:complete len:323 (-) Transcript_2884:270-1238(-)